MENGNTATGELGEQNCIASTPCTDGRRARISKWEDDQQRLLQQLRVELPNVWSRFKS
jgi:hypothetical protein